ncbi:MAG: hypothetical protein RL427_1321 [Bacteroidota bacterium]
MKKYTLLKVLLLLVCPLGVTAQIINGDFETIKPNFLPSNWGMNFFQQVVIDTQTGENITDQIQYTWCVPSMIYGTTEAQSGEYAMELSNAFNVTQNILIPGEAVLFSDATQDFPGWNPGIPLNATDNVEMIGFYYKFLPFGNDIAEAKVQVFDVDGNEIGMASIAISGTHSAFEYIYEPIQYTSNAAPALMYVTFSMAKEGSAPNFGSRLIIDNVVTNFDALQLETQPIAAGIRVYPTLVDQTLHISTSGLTSGPVIYSIVNTEGKIVKQNTTAGTSGYVYAMDVSMLAAGLYFINIDSTLGPITKKFIKK